MFHVDKDACRNKIMNLDMFEEKRGLSRGEQVERESLRNEIQLLAIKDETFWRQHSRINWLKEGDWNTKKFHKVVSHRKNINGIHGLVVNGD